ncbi:MAG: beta-ketoacyl-ACP synthase II, partial [Chloroflexota bacterium]|nr:beta-ketoacyl-ACP synthase II [Chloroflexota bacterium]
EARRMSRFSQFALAGSFQALQDAGLESGIGEEIGVVMGTGIGGSLNETVEAHRCLEEKGVRAVSPFYITAMLPNMASFQVSLAFGLKGPSSTVVTACAAGSQAIGQAFSLIRWGEAATMLAGGTEASLGPVGVAGFCAMRALSTRNDDPTGASRPFDRERDGFVVAEGCGVLVLEELEHAQERGARIYGEVLGYGVAGDAYHLSAPDPQGKGAARAMERALAQAKLSPEEVDYINAHATSTKLGDAAETLAVKRAFGEGAYRIPISATKSMTGHLLGASGAVEAIACLLTLRDQVVHPTINYQTPDAECDLDYVPNEARPHPVEVALSNSFAFGGVNASLVFGRFRG